MSAIATEDGALGSAPDCQPEIAPTMTMMRKASPAVAIRTTRIPCLGPAKPPATEPAVILPDYTSTYTVILYITCIC